MPTEGSVKHASACRSSFYTPEVVLELADIAVSCLMTMTMGDMAKVRLRF